MIRIRIEQFKIMDAIKYLQVFMGKGKDDSDKSDVVVQMKVEQDKVIFEANNKNIFGKVEVEALSVKGTGVLPYVEIKPFMKQFTRLNGATEIELTTNDGKTLEIMYPGRTKKVNGLEVTNPIVLNGMDLKFVSSPSPVINQDYDMLGEIMKKGVNKASEIVTPSTDAVRNGVCVTVNSTNNVILFECMNGKDNTLMVYGVGYKSSVDSRFFFDCHKAKTILANFSDSETLNVGISDNFVVFKQENKTAYLQLNAGAFPNIISFMPGQCLYQYQVNKQVLIGVASRIEGLLEGAVLKACTIELKHIDGSMRMANQKGKNEELFLVNGSQELTKKTFNVDTLIKLLYTFETDEIIFCVYSTGNVVAMPLNNNQYVHKVLLPRLADK